MTTFVLVPGAWHGAWCWYKVTPLLEARGHTVVTPDLPSLGRDTTPIADVSLALWRDHVVDVIDAQPEPVVLVGHSRGGVIISEVAEQRPERIEALVYLAGFLLPNGTSIAEQSAAGEPSLLSQFVRWSDDKTSFYVADEGRAPALYGECSAEDLALAKTCLRPEAAVVTHTPVAVTDARYGSVPRDYVECLRDNAITIATQRQMQAAQPCRRTLTLDTDHAPFFSAPRELVEFLLRAGDLTPPDAKSGT